MSSHSPSWNIVGSSVLGSTHARMGLPCQDAYATSILPDGTLLLVVADGAGSANRSEEGSRIAVSNSLHFLEWNLSQHVPESPEAWQLLLRDTLRDSRLALEEIVGDGDLYDLATTLLVVIVTQETLAAVQIGDGAIVCRDSSGPLRVLTPLTQSEYINTTCFLTGTAFEEDALFTVLPAGEIDAIAAFTDGVQYVAIGYPMNAAHPPFFNPLFAFVALEDSDSSELDAFLSSAQINERTDDDKTLVLVVRNATA
jgi:hypothetical protein